MRGCTQTTCAPSWRGAWRRPWWMWELGRSLCSSALASWWGGPPAQLLLCAQGTDALDTPSLGLSCHVCLKEN